MRFKSKQTLGKYRIQRRLAEGGFAEVYRALDTIEGIPVALKIPHDHMVTQELLEDFKSEVRLTAKLDHPNVMSVKNAEFIDGHFAVVYALGEGTLEDRLQRRMSADARVDLAEQMLQAVAYAHGQGVIHCDLKPENMILFSSNGRAPGARSPRSRSGRRAPDLGPSGLKLRLTDFGLSKLSARTIHGSGSGTVGYVAPEQAMGRPSFRSDVFSLGLILWQLFSGELPAWPFDWPPPGTGKLKQRVHVDFIAFLKRAIRVNQNLRFADGQAMLASFQRLKRAGRILKPASSKSGKRKAPSKSGGDWRELRLKQFERAYRKELDLRHACGRCKGPVSEAMKACPWCGHAPKRYSGASRHPERCPTCRRGRKKDWRYCAYCYGPGFKTVSERSYKDAAYTDRCRAPGCGGQLAPFMRYCPWCRAKTTKRWKISHTKHSCGRCGWAVLPDYWKVCPWCTKKLPAQ